MFRKYLFSTLVSVALLSGCKATGDHPTSQYSSQPHPKIQASLESSMAKYKVPGAVLAIKKSDGTVWKTTAGHSAAEAGSQQPMQSDMHFRIGSITKTFTSTLTLMLIDEGKLTLQTTINQVLPELNIVMGDQITVENLLEMRSGLEKYLANPDFSKYIAYDPGRIWRPAGLVHYSNIKVSEPDTTFLYNNGNYVLLGMMIEKLSGQTFDQILHDRILKPLHMNNTFFPYDLNLPNPFSYGYQYESTQKMMQNMTYYLNPTIAFSSGAMVSRVEDLLVWADAYFNGTLISPRLHKLQFELQPVDDNEGIDAYGLGAMRYQKLIGHDGFLPPYGSWLASHDDYQLILLINGTAEPGDVSPLVASYILNDIAILLDNGEFK